MKIQHVCAGLALLACAYSGPSLAYNFIDYCGSTPARWSGSSKTMSASGVSFPAGGHWFNALQTAMTRVNEPINFTLGFVTGDTSVAIGNGQSEVWFSADSTHSPAVAYNYTTCSGGSRITESDVVFYNGEPYTSNMTTTGLYGYGGGSRPFQTTAIHELGHAINLHHVNSEYNIMGQDYYHLHANGGLGRSYLGEDAADGAIYLYGSSGRQDLSLVHWKWVGSSGQYSTHGRTSLYTGSGATLPSTVVNGERRFDVNAGQTIQVELTAENNGASSHNVQIGFYLSNNSSITTADTLITTQNRTVSRDNVDTYRATIAVPSGLASGSYWIGAIIDSNNSVNEYAEDNNATYWPIQYTGGGGSNQPPVANFSFSVNNLTVSFTDGSSDPDGTIASRSWNFGDGTTSTATNPSKTYSAAGTYTVQLTVTDNQGASRSTSKSVTVGGSPPVLPECTASDTRQLGQNCKRSNRSRSSGYDYMFIYLPAGVPQLKITTSGGSGNANLYYNSSSWATTSSYHYSSTGPTNSETLTIPNPPSGWVYISLHAASAFSGVTVSTEY